MDSDHRRLMSSMRKDADAILLFKEEKDKNKISNNYTGDIQDGRVLSLIEKPDNPQTRIMGVGSYLLNNKVFHYIKNTPVSQLRGEVEITEVLSNMARHENVYAETLSGFYLNVNNLDDLNYANYVLRDKNYSQYKISIVIPAYNEEETIAEVVEEFKAHSDVDEVLVVDNNSMDNTQALSIEAGARVVLEKNLGYGNALKRGLDEAAGDIIILTEADLCLLSVYISTGHPRHAPVAHAILLSSDTWHFRFNCAASPAVFLSMAYGPHAKMCGRLSFCINFSRQSVINPLHPLEPSSV